MRVLELFAGIGAWHKAFSRLGIEGENYEIIDAIEIDKKTMDCYNLIHKTNFVNRDINDVYSYKYKDIDVICYSPPCQSWSKGGNKGGFKDDRGKLFYESLRLIRNVKPKIAIMENVKHLVSVDFKNDFDTMLAELDEAGYNNYWKVINALDVNFPQHRERVFVVSIRKDLDIDINFEFPEKRKLTRSFVDLLEVEWDKKHLHTEKGIAYMNRVTTRGRTHWDFGHHNDTDKNFVYCITKNFDKGVPYNVLIDKRKGLDIRKHTSLEVMRLMGYDDEDWERLKEGKSSDSLIYKVAGNSIVVDVVEAIFRKLFKN